MFYGYAFKNGYWTYRTPLQSAEEAWKWCNLHAGWMDEIRVADEWDHCVIHIKEGKLLFPNQNDGGERY